MTNPIAGRVSLVLLSTLFAGVTAAADTKPKIAVFSGPLATIHNSTPLVTSNKARQKYGLEKMKDADGSAVKYDHLAPQRLAAPVEVLIDYLSAHPLERDAAELYAPPDGYLDNHGRFHENRQSEDDRPVNMVTLQPEGK